MACYEISQSYYGLRMPKGLKKPGPISKLVDSTSLQYHSDVGVPLDFPKSPIPAGSTLPRF